MNPSTDKGRFCHPGTRKIRRALIIAAGMGLRFGARTNNSPKPLIPVGGLPLILRTIYTAREAGIRDFVIVTGFLARELEAFLEARKPEDVNLQFVYNEMWQRPNGWSVYRARDEFQEDEQFLLMMSDHVTEPELLRKLMERPLSKSSCRLAVDFNLARISDIEEATKVWVDGEGYIRRIGKGIREYNAVDTGFFLCSKTVFSALEEAFNEGRETLSDGIQKLADKGLMESTNIGSVFWQDVDNEDDLKRAESYLFNSLRSKTDSWITRHINRRVSLSITKRLASRSITPNQVTLINFMIGLCGCIAVFHGGSLSTVLGTLIFLLSSILDGCDGELARLRFQRSRMGAWLDVTTDNIVHWFLFYAISAITVGRYGFFPYAIFGGTLLLGSFISFVLTWFASGRSSGSRSGGKLLFSEATFRDVIQSRDALSSFVDKAANRDFAYLLVMLALIDRLQWFVILGGIGAPLFAWILYRRIALERFS